MIAKCRIKLEKLLSAWCEGISHRKGFNSLKQGVAFQGKNGKAASSRWLDVRKLTGEFFIFTDAGCVVNLAAA